MLSGDRTKNLKFTGWLIHLAGIFSIAAIVASYQVVVSALIAREQQEIATETLDKEQFLARNDEIRSKHKQLTERLEHLETNAVSMRYRIPEQPREAEFLKQVTQAADEEGLKIHKYERGSLDLKPTHTEFNVRLSCEGNDRPIVAFTGQPDVDLKPTHTEFNVRLSCEGNYRAIVGFLDRLAGLPRVATVQSMSLTAGPVDTYPFDLSLLLYYGAQSIEGKGP